jgi:hypothetical protein
MRRKQVISFSLWGEDPKYITGALINAQTAHVYYPGWTPRFYVPKNFSLDILNRLKSHGAEVIVIHDSGLPGLFWRFLAAGDPLVSAMISRDTDSRLSGRETAAVTDWLNSPYLFHIMRDHPWHNISIPGGMWGCKYPLLADIYQLIAPYYGCHDKQVDQYFLRDIVFPYVSPYALIHDEFFGGIDFPFKRKGLEFVGQPFDERNNTDPINLEILREFIP